MENRRNFYRILHVQPDAPQAMIKASYRTLMQTLKFHPDLGGDHWDAALINEAYAVLSNPEARAQYDIDLKGQYQRDTAVTESEHEYSPLLLPGKKAPEKVYEYCLFCKTPHCLHPNQPLISCVECQSPMQDWHSDTHAIWERKQERLTVRDKLTYYTFWPQAGVQAQFKDISVTGVSILSPDQILTNYYIKISSELLEAVASVKHCNYILEKECFEVGLQLIKARFIQSQGVFLSVSI